MPRFLIFTTLVALALPGAIGAQPASLFDDDGHTISVTAAPFQPRAGNGTKRFSRFDGSEFGLKFTNHFNPRDFYPPFFNGGGVASGDINRDGWPDVVAANGALIVIYMNQQGKQFAAIEVDVTGQKDVSIFNLALVDIDGDGWLDLFGTTYLQGNFYLLNDRGAFTSAGLRQPPRGNAVLSSTASFGDIDRDGDLDVVIGNWFAGAPKQHPPPHSRNEIWLNENGRFIASPLDELVGETLSTLLSDWNGDGWLDLAIGNDFAAPDIYYLGDGKGGFKPIEREDAIIPYSTQTTMSFDTADFDNDLDFDMFIDQTTARATGPAAEIQILGLEFYCDEVKIESERERCRANMATREGFFYGANYQPSHIRHCKSVPDPEDRRACIGMHVMMTAQRNRKQELCNHVPKQEARTHALCMNFF